MGLHEEAVEYLEHASDQLEDTILYFETQEENIIKSRQIRNQQPQSSNYHKPTQSQYATEQPQRTPKLEYGANRTCSAEYGKQANAPIPSSTQTGPPAQQSRLLPAQPQQVSRQTKQRQHSADNNDKNCHILFAGKPAASQLGKKQQRKVLKREKISIKDCSMPGLAEHEDINKQLGAAQQHLSCLLKESQKASDFATRGSLLQQQRKTLTNSKQQSSVNSKDLQDSSCDHMLILHHSAEQLEHSKMTSSILPKSPKQLQFASFTNNKDNNNYSTSLIDKHSSSGGRNISPVTTASIPPDSSTVMPFNKNDPKALITIEQLLAEKMHKSRYQCKMNLQICALQSQLGKHKDALIFGRRAAEICYKLIKNAQMLCKRYVAQIQRHIQARQSRGHYKGGGGLDQYGNTIPTQPDQASLGDSPDRPSQKLLKAQTEINDSFEDDYQAAQFCRRPPPMTRIEATLNTSSNFSISTNKYFQRQGGAKVPGRASSAVGSCGGSTIKRPRSSCSSSHSSNTSHTNGLTRLRLSKGSLAKLLPTLNRQGPLDVGSRSSRESSGQQTINSCRESSTESLDRIHTFNLKNSQTNYLAHHQGISEAQSVTALNQDQKQSVYQKGGPETGCGILTKSQQPLKQTDLQQSNIGSILSKPFESYGSGVGNKASNSIVVDGLIPKQSKQINTKHRHHKDTQSSQQNEEEAKEQEIGPKILQNFVQEIDLTKQTHINAADSRTASKKPTLLADLPGSSDKFRKSMLTVLQQTEHDNARNQDQLRKLKTSSQSQSRNVYIEESVKVLEQLIIQADPLLQELASIVKEFEDKSQKAAIDRDQEMIKKYGQQEFKDRRKRLKISFTNLQELQNLERDQRFKLNVRNTLGVKNSQDWIFNLNIGNVMHLNMMREQELNSKVENTHELTKDTMLEKVVLITSAYFCIATEIRFILQKDMVDTMHITKKDSEAYHAKALHIALLFLPEDCPLSQYINQTYCKNYLHPKLKLQKQRNAYISQKLSKQHQTRQRLLAQNLAEKEHKKQAMQEAKRAQTNLSLMQQTKEQVETMVIAKKLLIQTKSQEGLTSGAGSTVQTPIVGNSQIQLAKTATAAQVKSAAMQRKSGIQTDLLQRDKANNSKKQTKDITASSAQSSTASRHQATFKAPRPSTTLVQRKKQKKSSVIQTQTMHRACPSTLTQQASTSLIQGQQQHSGTQKILRGRSPSAGSNQYQIKSRASPREQHQKKKQTASSSGQKRDCSSVRKIKINLGQLASPEQNWPQAAQGQHQTQRWQQLKKSSCFTNEVWLGKDEISLSQTHTESQSLRHNQQLKSASASSSSNHGHKQQRHTVGANIPRHIQSSIQVKQSLGDCSNSSAAAGVSQNITTSAAFSSSGHSHNLKSQPTLLLCSTQNGPATGTPTISAAVTTNQQQDSQKQHSIMLAALKHLQIKAHNPTMQQSSKKKRTVNQI